MAISEESSRGHKEHEAIAIVGFSLKFPQDADSAEGFWELLVNGRSALTEIPPERFNIDAFYHKDPDRHDTMNARGGHFLKENLAAFDAPFFSMARAEADCMDPQQRALLEGAYHALENAGIPMEAVAGSKTSVFVGSFSREYDALLSRDPELYAKYKATGTGTAMLANRISWFYDLRGPSISLDTACSSSLNALHLCCQSLRSRESSMGLVCGSNIILNPETNFIPLSNMNFLSSESKCFSFDHRANGYARGEGNAVVVLKLLSQAVKDGDLIRGVIQATGANQDGRTPGITQPSSEAQEALIRHTYDAVGLGLGSTHFFEAHGTGTTLGDLMEATAIAKVFKGENDPAVPLRIGAVKSNIGHLEGVAGLAGLIKSVLILEKGIIPPNMWFEKPGTSIDTQKWNIKFPVEREPWPTSGLRRASVNSFGYGGANAHVVLDDAYHFLQLHNITGKHCTTVAPSATVVNGIDTQATIPVNGQRQGKRVVSLQKPSVFIWSAADQGGLARLASKYAERLRNLKDPGDRYFEDLAYTLSDRRSFLSWKSFAIAESITDLLQKLQLGLPKPIRSSTKSPVIGFLFTGQGANWPQMGKELYMYAAYRMSLERTAVYLESLGCEWNIIDELFKEDRESHVKSAAYSQPLCTALQLALVDLFANWKVYPASVLGHSSGEIAAAYCAGAVSQEFACKLAYYRGVVTARLEVDDSRKGSMMVVALSESEVAEYLTKLQHRQNFGHLTVACVNSPTNVTVSGDAKAVELLKTMLDADNVFVRKLHVGVAYHSAHMNRVADEYADLIRESKPSERSLSSLKPRMYSSLTGSIVSPADLVLPEYWIRNLVSKVNFTDALKQMYLESARQSQPHAYDFFYLMEIGPHSALRRSVNETLHALAPPEEIVYGSAIVQGVGALQSVCEQAGRLRCHGYDIELKAVNSPGQQPSALRSLHDLPEYPFNHDQLYWLESRLSKNFRHRTHGRHELLGTRVNDWNPQDARWRNMIRFAESPWIADHKFNGSELYPAAGMLVMAIEAVREISDPSLTICGYEFEDVRFLKPLLVSLGPEGTETQLRLQPRTADNRSATFSFHLYTYAEEECVEVCRGNITITYFTGHESTPPSKALVSGKQQTCSNSSAQDKRFRRTVDKVDLYENLDKLGFSFGPWFQSLNEVNYTDKGQAAAMLDLRFWKKMFSEENYRSHVIHPIALDAVFHLTIAALAKGGWEPIPTMVPTQLRSMWISDKLRSDKSLDVMDLLASQTFRGYREAEFCVSGQDPTSDECLILLEGYRGTAISNLESSSFSEHGPKALGFKLDWRPDWTTLSNGEVAQFCATAAADCIRPTQRQTQDLELACLGYISTALCEMQASLDVRPHEEYLERYLQWAKRQKERFDDLGCFPSGTQSQSHAHAPLDTPTGDHQGPEWELYRTVGESLMPVLLGDVNPLDLLFRGPLLEAFYSGLTFTASYKMLAAYVGLLVHKDSDLKILELGAGTGGATTYILDEISAGHHAEARTPRCGQYVYTDLSSGFFEGAKKRFHAYKQRLSYRTLDIEKDPAAQGFEAEYDLVIAASVLHATSDIDLTLSHTRQLLKPGGKMVLFEPSNPDCLRIPFVFGLLPGWWLGNEAQDRYWSPLLSDKGWDLALKRSNFSGADITLHDQDSPTHAFSTIVTTAPTANKEAVENLRTLIITSGASSAQSEIATKIKETQESFSRPGCSCAIVPYCGLDLQNTRDIFCIFLLELDRSVFNNLSETMFKMLKDVFRSSSRILWLRIGDDNVANNPDFGLVTGLGRSVNSENSHLHFVELAIEGNLSAADTARFIDEAYQGMLFGPTGLRETEYRGSEGMLYIPRVDEDTRLNDFIHTKTGVHKASTRRLKDDGGRALELTVNSPGLLDSLQFVDDLSVDQPLQPDEIEINVKAIGVNFKDIMIAMGQLPSSTIGCECSGIVTKVGEKAASNFCPGDRVYCLVDGAYKTNTRTYAKATAKVPDEVTLETAAGMPLIFCTAYYSLIYLANLAAGDSILIHSGAGGVGQAAIQIAQIKNADIYVTIGGEDKRQLLTEVYGISDDHILSGRDLDLASKVYSILPNGFDVVLNSRPGKGMQASLECLAPFGRFIEIGKADIEANEKLPLSHFARNISFSSVDLMVIFNTSKALTGRLMTAVMEMFARKQIRPPHPLHVSSVAKLEQGFRYLQSGKNVGKMVITMQEDDLVPMLPRTKPTYRFDRDATYVIAGGFGGLGRSITRWMVRWGARHLLILSRSGPASADALAFVEELEAQSVTIVAPSCDIGDEDSVISMLQAHSHAMPPIKGCIQGSMVLKDGLFENLSLDDFQAAIRPKAQGSWNLHLHLPPNLDFYILLSSTGGVIGSRGQSNYAAGNTYQDALARYRNARGQKCFSLDLGMVLAVGFAAERRDVTTRLKNAGYHGIREIEFLAIIEYLCDPGRTCTELADVQIITGLESPKATSGAEWFYWLRRPMFRHLLNMNRGQASSSGTKEPSAPATDYAALLKAAESQHDAGAVVTEALVGRLSGSLDVDRKQIDPQKPMHMFGVDSLVAVEIRYWLMKHLQADLSIFEILSNVPLAELAHKIAGKSGLFSGPST